MNLLRHAALAVVLVGSVGAAHAGQIVNIDGTNSVGTTVYLAAGTYDVSYAGIAGGGLYDAYALYVNGGAHTGYTDQLSISLGAATNFGTAATYDYLVGNVQQTYATASQALAAYQNALATDTMSLSASYANQNYNQQVNKIEFTLASAGNVTFTAPDVYYPDNSGGVSLSLSQAAVPEPATLGLLAIGMIGSIAARRRARA